MAKKSPPNPYYPYANEQQYRVAKAIDELREVYGITREQPEIRERVDKMFDPLMELADLIEDQLSAEEQEKREAALAKKAAAEAARKEEVASGS